MDPEGPGKSSDGEPNEQQRPEEQENVQPGSDVTKPAEGDILDQGVTFDQALEELGCSIDGDEYMTEKSVRICTYDEGYKPRQALFSCWTCLKDDRYSAICVGCATNCHDGHDLHPMHTRRNFRCDCGNSRTPDIKCGFVEDKPAENSRNVYDPSFKAIYCNGCVWDPLKKDDAMAMCVLCENWFHYAHTGLQGIAEDDGADLICRSCVTKHPWFAGVSKRDGKFCIQKYIESGAAPASEQITAVLIGPSEDWRKDLCTCDACQRILENDEVEFLTNPDDLLSTYENEIGVEEERAKEARSGEEIILEIANRHNLDRESSVMALQAYGELKEHLREFFSTVNENGGEVVTGEMVARFFAEKRARRRQEGDEEAKRPRYDEEPPNDEAD